MPLAVTAVRLTDVPPVLVTVSCKLLLLPTGTLPKVRLDGDSERVPAVTPVPAKAAVSAPLFVEEVTESVPVAEPAEAGVNTTEKFATCPGASVNGTEIPDSENPAPDTVAAEIVALDPPVLVSAAAMVCDFPTWTFGKSKLPGLNTTLPACTPSPDTVIEELAALEEDAPCLVDSEALPLSEILPFTTPVAVGMKLIVAGTLWPGARVTGRVSPLSVKELLETDACKIVTDDPPGLPRVTFWDWLLPTVTFPNDRELELGTMEPALTPLPLTLILAVPFAVERVTLPEGFPTAPGVKDTTTFVDWPAPMVTGRVGDTSWKLGSEEEALVTVTDEVEVFVTVSDRVLLAPMTTVPKLNV